MERYTLREGGRVLCPTERLEAALERLAAFEDLACGLEEEQQSISRRLEELRGQRKEKTVQFRELLAQGPLTIEMEDYGGFEKVGPLGTTLPRNDTSITTQPGDVILYQGNQITIYYGTNSWSFTRLARIDDPSDLREKLGDGAVSVTFSLE